LPKKKVNGERGGGVTSKETKDGLNSTEKK